MDDNVVRKYQFKNLPPNKFRNNFQPLLADLVWEDARIKQQGMDISFGEHMRSTPHCIKRFVDIDHAWQPQEVTDILETKTTAVVNEQIDTYQKIVDDNAPEPDNSRMKEIRKEKAREAVLGELSNWLVARALREIEHDKEYVQEDGVKLREQYADKSVPIQDLEYTPFNTGMLKASREFRLKNEKCEIAEAKKAFDKKIKAQQNGKGFYGNWAFKDDEEEAIARVILRAVTDEPVTANNVFRQALDIEGPSVLKDIEIVWVEDPAYVDYGNEKPKKVATSKGTSGKRKRASPRESASPPKRKSPPKSVEPPKRTSPRNKASSATAQLVVKLKVPQAFLQRFVEAKDESNADEVSDSMSELTEFTKGSEGDPMEVDKE